MEQVCIMPVPSLFKTDVIPMKKYKIGLLFPRSSLYPGIGFDVTESFRAGLNHFGADDVQVVNESIGIGGMGDDVYEKAEKMLLNENVDILVAYVDHFAAEKIEPLATAANRILIIMDPGASIPTSWNASPLRFHITLDAAFGSRVAGRIAGMAGAQNSIFATSFYDGGYLNCSALVNGYSQQGGNVHYNFVAPFRFEEFDIQPLKQAIETQQPDAILGQLSVDMGALFLKDYKEAGLADKTRFFASPFLFEETFLDSLSFPFEGITGCVPWSRELDNDMNRTYIKVMTEDYGREPNCFGALAWDTAQFAVNVIGALKMYGNNGKKAAEGLAGTAFEGTRGQTRLDGKTNYFTAPVYHATVVPAENGNSKLALSGEVAFREEEWEAFTSQPTTGVFSRWTNTYLCTT
ncbi:ABC transporter substrate-binding protein [Chitinophagaceae bacterium MMS25-I14]